MIHLQYFKKSDENEKIKKKIGRRNGKIETDLQCFSCQCSPPEPELIALAQLLVQDSVLKRNKI